MFELPKWIVDALKKWFGKRRTQVLILFIACGSATAYLLSHRPTYTQALAISFWLCAALWYLRSTYAKTISGRRMKAMLVLLLIGSFCWLFALGWYMTSTRRRIAILVRSAEEFSDRGLFVDAAENYDAAASLAHACGDFIREMECLCKLGHSEFSASRRREAQKHYETCRKIAVDLKNEKHQGDAEIGLGNLAWFEGKIDLARQDYQDALRGFEGTNDIEGEADAHAGLGKLEEEYLKNDAARLDLTSALDLYAKTKSIRGRVETLIAMGRLERTTGNYDAARNCYTEAEQLSQQNRYRLQEANAVLFLAELESVLNHPPAAHDGFGKALGMYQAMGNRVGEGNAQRMIGDLDVSEKNYDVAIQHYNEALSSYESQNNLVGIGAANAGLGIVNGTYGRHDVAHAYFMKAREAFQKADDVRGEANVDLFDGEAFAYMGNAGAAREMFHRSESLYGRLGMNSMVAQVRTEEERRLGAGPQ